MELRSGAWYGPALTPPHHTHTQSLRGALEPLGTQPEAAAAPRDRYTTGGTGERCGLVRRQLPHSGARAVLSCCGAGADAVVGLAIFITFR
jgi:hypothetical protein